MSDIATVLMRERITLSRSAAPASYLSHPLRRWTHRAGVFHPDMHAAATMALIRAVVQWLGMVERSSRRSGLVGRHDSRGRKVERHQGSNLPSAVVLIAVCRRFIRHLSSSSSHVCSALLTSCPTTRAPWSGYATRAPRPAWSSTAEHRQSPSANGCGPFRLAASGPEPAGTSTSPEPHDIARSFVFPEGLTGRPASGIKEPCPVSRLGMRGDIRSGFGLAPEVDSKRLAGPLGEGPGRFREGVAFAWFHWGITC
jgi:hypothetical protein